MTNLYFYSGGTKMAAIAETPDPCEGKIPCVILCHGYTSYRDEFGGFSRLADAFREEGIGTVRLDFRGCGESTDAHAPKGRMLCGTQWIEDIGNAFCFVQTLPWVDPGNVSLLGMSMGGAAVLSALKFLPDLKKAVAVAPVNDGRRWLEGLWKKRSGEGGWAGFLEEIERHARQRALTGIDEMTGVDSILAFEKADYDLFVANTGRFPLSTATASWSSAEEIVKKVNAQRELQSSANDIPVLFVHGTGDTLVPHEGTVRMYEAYAHTKKLILAKGKEHGMLLDNDIQAVTAEMVRWIASEPAQSQEILQL